MFNKAKKTFNRNLIKKKLECHIFIKAECLPVCLYKLLSISNIVPLPSRYRYNNAKKVSAIFAGEIKWEKQNCHPKNRSTRSGVEPTLISNNIECESGIFSFHPAALELDPFTEN